MKKVIQMEETVRFTCPPIEGKLTPPALSCCFSFEKVRLFYPGKDANTIELGGRVLREIVTNVSLLSVGALFGASLYDAVVLAPNLRGGPNGLEHGRLFMTRATPANLFRVAAPITQVLLLLAVIANWSNPQCRWPLAGSLVALVINDVITFSYHYPRNR